MKIEEFAGMSREDQVRAVEAATAKQLDAIESYYVGLGYAKDGQALTRVALRRASLAKKDPTPELLERAETTGVNKFAATLAGKE